MSIRTLLGALLLALAGPVAAQIPLKIYAQELVDRTVAANGPDDQQTQLRKALALRDELRAQIASAEELEALDP